MKTHATITSLEAVSLEEARAYLDDANGDELNAAFALAADRNELDGGSSSPPDDAEVHHALFLLRRASGQTAPSFDSMRVQLRHKRLAA
ncbi:MAG: hypothetical protein ABIP89_00640 [Polyangiaceae bacterium]